MNRPNLSRRLAAALLVAGLYGLASGVIAAPVNVNTANAETLAASLDGVGPSLARAIVSDRAEHGPYKAPADLARVKGIGSKVIERNRANILVADPPRAAARH